MLIMLMMLNTDCVDNVLHKLCSTQIIIFLFLKFCFFFFPTLLNLSTSKTESNWIEFKSKIYFFMMMMMWWPQRKKKIVLISLYEELVVLPSQTEKKSNQQFLINLRNISTKEALSAKTDSFFTFKIQNTKTFHTHFNSNEFVFSQTPFCFPFKCIHKSTG